MKKVKYFLSMFLLVFAMLAISGTTVEASTKTDALKAYSKKLSKSTINRGGVICHLNRCYFSIAYIDNNSVPELLVHYEEPCHADGYLTIYTYRNGKVKMLERLSGNQFKNQGYYPKKGIFNDNYTGMGISAYSYYKLSKGTVKDLNLRKFYNYNYEPRVIDYSYYDTNISSDDFKYVLKSYVGTKKYKKFSWHKNTTSNRRKYIH